jgi:hypothetical protein
MTKTILASILLMAASNVIWAGIVSCPPPQSGVVLDAVGGSADFACPGDPSAVKARLILSGSFSDNSSAGPEMSVVFNGTGGGFDLTCTAIGVTFGTQTLGACTATGEWMDVAGLSAFILTITGGAGSDPLPFLAAASAAVETAVPEPAQLFNLLTGFGLVCFAGWARIPKR